MRRYAFLFDMNAKTRGTIRIPIRYECQNPWNASTKYINRCGSVERICRETHASVERICQKCVRVRFKTDSTALTIAQACRSSPFPMPIDDDCSSLSDASTRYCF